MLCDFEAANEKKTKPTTICLICCLIYVFKCLLQDLFYRVFGRPEQKLQGELALVTGGGGGLGRLISLRLSKLGVDIVIWDIKQEGNFYLSLTAKLIDWKNFGIFSNANILPVKKNQKSLRLFHKF